MRVRCSNPRCRGLITSITPTGWSTCKQCGTETEVERIGDTKFCPACDTEHPIEEFGRNVDRPDGRNRICRTKQNERLKRSRQRDGYAGQRAYNRTQREAARRFARRFPDEWDEIYAQAEAYERSQSARDQQEARELRRRS